MAFFGTSTVGIVRREGDRAEVLDLPFDDLGRALEAGLTLDQLASAPAGKSLALDAVQLRAPVPAPPNLWIAGANYHAHNLEAGIKETPKHPPTALIAAASITGPGGDIVLPAIAPEKVDYECEVALVIGREAKDIGEDEVWDHIFGLTGAQDISARDVQFGSFSMGSDVAKGKSFDTFTPLGPWVATPDEFPDPNDIGVRTLVDGEVRQNGRTSDMIYNIAQIVSFMSRFTTLRPGDVMLTGTPEGVALASGKYLRAGQVLRTEIEVIGAMEHRIVAEN